MSWKIAFLAVLLSFASADQYCRGLALGGGNDLGAYQAGAISGLLTTLTAQETDYQIVTGLGVGSINGLIVSQFNSSQNAKIAETLNDFWETSKRSDFLKDWAFGRVEGHLKRTGLYNSAPTYKTIGKLMNLGPKFVRHFTVGATDLISGEILIFDSNHNRTTLQTGIYGSASIYVEMPVVPFQDYLLVEGSVQYTADLIGVVNYCLDQGYAEENIIIDTVFVQAAKLDSVDAQHYKTLDVVKRVAQVYLYDGVNISLQIAENTYPDVNFRYILRPKKSYRENHERFGFTKHELKSLFADGMKDAVDSITA
jgi:hypothetical protein